MFPFFLLFCPIVADDNIITIHENYQRDMNKRVVIQYNQRERRTKGKYIATHFHQSKKCLSMR